MDSDLLGIIHFIVWDSQVDKKNSYIFSNQIYLDGINWNSFQCSKGFMALILALVFLITENPVIVSLQMGACQIYPAQHETF